MDGKTFSWNCRSFTKKNAALQFTITDFDPKIDIIALQETETAVKLAGFASFGELPTVQRT